MKKAASSFRYGLAALTLALTATTMAAPPAPKRETDRYNAELDLILAQQLRGQNFNASDQPAPDDERLRRLNKVLNQVNTGIVPQMTGWSRTEIACSLTRASEMEASHIGYTNKTLAGSAFELATQATILKKKLGCASDPADHEDADDIRVSSSPVRYQPV